MITLMLLASFLSPSAEAAPRLNPPANGKVCLARNYTDDHMRSNPRQLLSRMHVLISQERFEGGSFTAAKVVGEKDGIRYGNEATCTPEADGGLRCQIECDGGAFNLKSRNGNRANFHVAKDYYFPLYRQGADPENARDEDTLNLDDKDRDNNLFSLEHTDAATCEREWKLYKEVPAFGC